MDKNLHNYRKSYEKGALLEEEVLNDPIKQFDIWFKEADAAPQIEEANAMTISTVDKQGMPSGRVVLLKEFTNDGFVFYTNYNSKKGTSISNNNKVCASFFWPALERQVIINGMASKVSEAQSQNYFNERPRASQLGALVSNQSSPIESREALSQKLKTLEETYKDKKIPKPEHWGGYIIKPVAMEFWQGRSSRLHDRIVYLKTDSGVWDLQRLQP